VSVANATLIILLFNAQAGKVMGTRYSPTNSFGDPEKFEAEIPTLLRLRENERLLPKHKIVKPDAYGYVLFDKNRYSVPTKGFGPSLIMTYDHDTIHILDEKELLVEHLRSWD
jgi:hypothetical protein